MLDLKRDTSVRNILIAAAALTLVYLLRWVLLPFVLAATLAYIAGPVVRWLERRWRWPRLVSVVAAYAGGLLLGTGVAAWAWLALWPEMSQLLVDAPRLAEQTVRFVLGDGHRTIGGQQVSAASAAEAMEEWLRGPLSAQTALRYAAAAAMAFFLVLVLTFYFMLDAARLQRGALWLVPPARRPWVADVARQIDPMLRRYLLGVLIVMAYSLIITWSYVGPIAGLPHALVLAVVVAVLEPVPVVGPLVSASLVGALSLQTGDPWTIAAFGVYMLIYRVGTDNIIEPLIVGRFIDLHPVVVLLAFAVGGALLGILGLLIAVPVAGALKIALRAAYAEHRPNLPQAA